MSDVIFSKKTREDIRSLLVEVEVYAMCEYGANDFESVAMLGHKGIIEYTDTELYEEMKQLVNVGDEGDEELYDVVEIEYGLYKILRGKVA